METYDDRPISVYDNLSMPSAAHTASHTPRVKAATITNTPPTATSPTSPTNGTARSPYTDISFNFNANKQQSHLLPNGNRSLNQSQQQPQQQQQQQQLPLPQHQQPQPQTASSSQVHPNYATPLKAASAASTNTAAANTTPLQSQRPQYQQPPIMAATSASPAQRPLSQHSQTELNEASQSIAAVKAALNDAKSKFFGLNGYAEPQDSAEHTPALNESQPRVKIITKKPLPPPKPQPQPKYQNIPENSAIFRKQPPLLPPKPNCSETNNASSPAPLSPATPVIPVNGYNTPEPVAPTMSSNTASAPAQQQLAASQSPSPAKTLPYAGYKQIPLNDIEVSQPSQAVYMSTTVPQNIKGSKIAGRHTPTRNSLRHSRMLVVNNKNYQGVQHPNPMNFKYPNLARWLLILQIIVGITLLLLAIWIFCLAPNTAIQYNPYWSGLALLLAGILGLVLVRYQRIKRHKVRENCFLFLRADSYLLALLALLLCSVALVCATIQVVRLTASDSKCVSTNILQEHGSCSCTFNVNQSTLAHMSTSNMNGTVDDANGLLDEEEFSEEFADHSYKVEYRDLSCSEVNGVWTFILWLSIALNALGFITTFAYILLLACYRHNSKRFYSSVHTSTF